MGCDIPGCIETANNDIDNTTQTKHSRRLIELTIATEG